MADTGWLLPTNAAEIDDEAKAFWANLTNLYDNNDVGAIGSTGGSDVDSDTLKTFDYNGAVPAGATIDGFEVRMRLNAETSGSNTIESVMVGLDDSTLGTEKTPGTTVTVGSWVDYDIGGASDLWGHTTPSDSDVNATQFQVRTKYHFQTGLDVDHVSVKIYYTEATPTPRRRHIGFHYG